MPDSCEVARQAAQNAFHGDDLRVLVSSAGLRADMVNYSTSSPASDAAGHANLPTTAL